MQLAKLKNRGWDKHYKPLFRVFFSLWRNKLARLTLALIFSQNKVRHSLFCFARVGSNLTSIDWLSERVKRTRLLHQIGTYAAEAVSLVKYPQFEGQGFESGRRRHRADNGRKR
jgi:hypothetical protein